MFGTTLAGCDPPPVLELVDPAFDFFTLSVGDSVTFDSLFAVFLRPNARFPGAS